MTYENLSGGTGRNVYFRPQRYRVEALFGSTRPVVRIGELQGQLLDLSVGGMALKVRKGRIQANASVPVELWLEDEKAFSARGEVIRVDHERGRVAVRFIDSLPRISSLRALAAGRMASAAIQQGSAVYDYVPAEYQGAVFAAVRFLSHWKAFLDGREKEIRNLGDGEEESRTEELERLAEQRMRAEWRMVHDRANEAAEKVFAAPELVQPSKRLTELLVTPLLVSGPIWRRAFAKPLGYPGDFQFMNYIYEEKRAGSSVYSRIMHQLGREELLAATVLDRCRFLVREIQRTIRQGMTRRVSEVRICSIGAGPARELEEVIRGESGSVRLSVWLIDQDERALAFAYERLRRAAGASGWSIRINCRFISFREMFRDPSLMGEMAGQDLIYSAGLFDYLRREIATQLVTDLASMLNGKGRLLVGNAALAERIRWVPEFVLDWRLRYRRASEVLELGANLPPTLRQEVVQDDSGVWWFLSVQSS